MSVSIVVPILNEASLICDFLVRLRRAAPSAELVVVDGGSDDDSARLAFPCADRVITTPPGRGRQMNAGAAVARGDIVWFVHADSRVPLDGSAAIEEFFSNPKAVGGCFTLRIVPTRRIYRVRDAIGNLCVDLFGIALGDRSLFCRRKTFLALGGYSTEPLFEDADLYRKLARAGTTRRLSPGIQTSARRYESQGPARTCLFYGFVMLLYWLGFSRTRLQNLVGWFSSRFDAADKRNASERVLGAKEIQCVTLRRPLYNSIQIPKHPIL